MPRDPAPDSTDILCEDCGYCLNGLPTTGLCPECGSSIALSTTDSPRRDPAWENVSIVPARSRYLQTIRPILRHPRAFFKTLTLRPNNPSSKRFMTIALATASVMNAFTIILHYLITTQIAPAVSWLPSLMIQIVLIPMIAYLIWWYSFELIGYLSTIEGRYWGYRMDRAIVRRTIQYVSIHLPFISILPLLIVAGYAVLLQIKLEMGLYMLQYLYILSGLLVICAVYLFKIYWIAMKSMMWGNPVDMSQVSASGAKPYNG